MNKVILVHIRWKYIIYLILFFFELNILNSVELTETYNKSYIDKINNLKTNNELVKISYPDMSICGGSIDGYYLNDSLVLIEATKSISFDNYSKTFYLENNKHLKIIYRKIKADEKRYAEEYPFEKFEFDISNMKYFDTTYTFSFADEIKFRKESNYKLISQNLDFEVLSNLKECANSIKFELNKVINIIDSLKYIQEMPYTCEMELCGDELYWNSVRLKLNAIEYLIEKLDDTTKTKANVKLFGGQYTVADIAYDVICEIIHDIPTFELLGIPFDKEGCGYCAYWNHLNESYENREKFKESVKNWYYKNKENLIWIESNDFETCDCRGDHPNQGHYSLKNNNSGGVKHK